MSRWMARFGLSVAILGAVSACAHRPTHQPSDPLEKVNRSIFAFNNVADAYVLEPVARGYVRVVPGPVRLGIGNFLSNLGYPVVIANDLLQLKLVQTAKDTGRFLMNSTLGIGGLFDPATAAGLPEADEDFGQTLGHWGVGDGWFLMLPLLGPSSNRDLVGLVADTYAQPINHVDLEHEDEIRYGLIVLGALDTRAALLGTEQLLREQFDPYVFLRTAYLDRRRNLVHDGNAPVEEIEYEDFDY